MIINGIKQIINQCGSLNSRPFTKTSSMKAARTKEDAKMMDYFSIDAMREGEEIEKLKAELHKLIGENKALRLIAGFNQRQYITDTKDKECMIIDIHTGKRVVNRV